MPDGAGAQGRMVAERILLGMLVLSIALGCGYVLYPFFSALLWAAILVFSTWPLFRQLRRVGLDRVSAALLMVLLAGVVVVVPLGLAIPAGAKDIAHLRALLQGSLQGGLPGPPGWLADVPLAGPGMADLWQHWADDLSSMGEFFRPYFGAIAEGSLTVLLRIAHGVVSFGFALFISFFFYVYGESMTGSLHAILGRIAGGYADRLISVTGLAVRGTVYGILGNALVQGLLTYLGLWLIEMPRAALLGSLAGLLALLPVGAPLVWVPATLWLLGSGRTGHGVFLAIYGTVVVSGLDHIIRPYFIARGARLPFLLTVLGVLGGVFAFGLLGIFLGPVLLGVGLTLLNEFAAGGRGAVRR